MAQDASSVNTSGNDHNLPEVLIPAETEHLPPLDGGEKEHYLPDALQLVPPPFNTQNLYTAQPGSDTPSGSTLWRKKRLWLPLATLVFLAAVGSCQQPNFQRAAELNSRVGPSEGFACIIEHNNRVGPSEGFVRSVKHKNNNNNPPSAISETAEL
ncbi:MAG: hypothetical protein L6R38_000562 [Xanthoria sp. 2 TBL-2021]|nr:MAG: hypothetical protein L6R38_000562 [Xanthoria sp. 2 TBL-2021]